MCSGQLDVGCILTFAANARIFRNILSQLLVQIVLPIFWELQAALSFLCAMYHCSIARRQILEDHPLIRPMSVLGFLQQFSIQCEHIRLEVVSFPWKAVRFGFVQVK